MSQENVETVHRFYDAWNRGATDDVLGGVDEDIEFHLMGGLANLIGEEFDGREGLLRLWRDFAATVEGHFAIERTFDLGERVAVIAALKATGGESGAPVTLRFGQVWTFRDAKVIRVDSYYGTTEALEAAGLRE